VKLWRLYLKLGIMCWLVVGLSIGLAQRQPPNRVVHIDVQTQTLEGMREDDPLWRCKQMGNHQCYPGEVVP
jgi:hypothetical protein